MIQYVCIMCRMYLHAAAPRITNSSSNLTVPVQSTVTLECVAVGFPRPDGITWTTNSLLYTASNLEDFTSENQIDDFTVQSLLLLPSVLLDSRGIYNCTAENSEGVDFAIMELLISGRFCYKEFSCFVVLLLTPCSDY